MGYLRLRAVFNLLSSRIAHARSAAACLVGLPRGSLPGFGGREDISLRCSLPYFKRTARPPALGI
ncbi:MAG: hypothetical protein DRI26_10130 [Chloroflexi bacterium]|nr:MAG: hypothetical protein DRI26_10130 [Chloroflexota bacterium]